MAKSHSGDCRYLAAGSMAKLDAERDTERFADLNAGD
jgi:hypothetical protein